MAALVSSNGAQRYTPVPLRKALFVFGMQKDFVSIDGRYRMVNAEDLTAKIMALVPCFRQYGLVVWITTSNTSPAADHGPYLVAPTTHTTPRHHEIGVGESAAQGPDTNIQQTDDFLTNNVNGELYCDPAATGVEDIVEVQDLRLAEDIRIIKAHYSAYTGTSLLHIMRTKFVTEIFMVGAVSNYCIYATACEAGQYGMQINVVQDCLGYRSFDSHCESLRYLSREVGANSITTENLLDLIGADAGEHGLLPDAPAWQMPAPSTYVAPSASTIMNGQSAEQLAYPDHVSVASSAMDLEDDRSAVLGAPPPPPAIDTASEVPSAAIAPPASTARSRNKVPSLASLPTKGPGDSIGAGDSYIVHNVMPLSKEHGDQLFRDLLSEVSWQTMSHAGGAAPRLVCYQGDVDEIDGSSPIYRHPSDTVLPLMHWTPTVLLVREHVQQIVGHDLNHAFVQLYRGGNDSISEHSDKTLDIAIGSNIVNVSFGAQRTMRLRSKRTGTPGDRTTERVHLPHNSALVMGWNTNANYLHGIQPDRRPKQELTAAETAFEALRISITFRHIATFVNSDATLIWGQGATSDSEPQPVVNNSGPARETLLKAFGKENQTTGSGFASAAAAWADIYGTGSDVIHLSANPPANKALVFLAKESREDHNETLLACLRIANVDFDVMQYIDVGSSEIITALRDPDESIRRVPTPGDEVKYRDNDTCHTEVRGLISILQYLAAKKDQPTWRTAREISLLNEIARDSKDVLETIEEALCVTADTTRMPSRATDSIERGPFLLGPEISFADVVYMREVHSSLEGGTAHGRLTRRWAEAVRSRLLEMNVSPAALSHRGDRP